MNYPWRKLFSRGKSPGISSKELCMGRPYQILLPLFSLFLVRVDLTDLIPLQMEVVILKVYDGDTVLIKRGAFEHKVRLSRIDAPEKGQPFLSRKQDAGLFARNCLRKEMKKEATLHIYGHDIYQRILGDIDQVSLTLIRRGCVSLYPHATFGSQKEKQLYLREYFSARRLKRGVWAFGGFAQPKAWRKKNKKYFRKRI